MKKAFCVILCVLLAAPLLTAAFAVGMHEHGGVLEALRTEADLETPCCGVFRCSECGEQYEASVTPADVGMPIVKLEGSMEGISKNNKVTLTASYDDGNRVAFTSSATLKWQGGTSVNYTKKNYNIQFLKESGSKNKVELDPAWGKQSKYTLKANWVDFSAARNLVSAKLWGEIVHSRCRDDRLDPLVNGGGVDGFPVLLYHNGDFQGLYTLNTPKDNWIFGMDGKKVREGLLFGNKWTDSVWLKAPIADVNDPTGSGWEVEYCSTEDDPEVGIGWLGTGMNRLIDFLCRNDGEALKAGLDGYTDVGRCIDYMLFIYFICASDNTGKNTLWVTYDGVSYVPSAYDLDGTWGMKYDGTFPAPSPSWNNFGALQGNLMFVRLQKNYYPELAARYAELREDVLSLGNIKRQFESFIGRVPTLVYAAEAERWPDEPGIAQNSLSQIMDFAKARTAALDAAFGVTVNEKTESAYRAAFSCEKWVKTYVYPSPDHSAGAVRAASAYSFDPATGDPTKSDGQIEFAVEVPENYAAEAEVSPADGFSSLDGPEKDGNLNVFRITGVSKDLCVRVRTAEVIDCVKLSLPPYKLIYTEGKDPLDVNGCKLIIEYKSGNSATVDVTPDMVSGFDNTGPGAQTLTVSYRGYELTFDVEIVHDYVAAVTPPSCTESGYTEYRCAACGDVYFTDRVEAPGHAPGYWRVISAPSAEQEGVRARSCLRCGAEIEQSALEDPFSDLAEGAWFTEGALFCYNNGLMAGTSESAFAPGADFTRAMFVTVLARIDGADTSDCSGRSFTDVPEGKWYSKTVEWAYKNGYTGGTGNGAFSPDAAVTRETLAQFLYNYSEKKGFDVGAVDSLGSYTDAGTVSGWAKNAVNWAVGTGLISGTSKNALSPKATATRAQVALIIMKYTEIVN